METGGICNKAIWENLDHEYIMFTVKFFQFVISLKFFMVKFGDEGEQLTLSQMLFDSPDHSQ